MGTLLINTESGNEMAHGICFFSVVTEYFFSRIGLLP
jgi:hypothetical protein